MAKINPIAPKIQLKDLCPVQELTGLNDMGYAIFSMLIPHGFVEWSLSNAVYLLKLEGLGSGFRSKAILIAMLRKSHSIMKMRFLS